MNWKDILKATLAFILSYVGWNLLDYIKGLLNTQTPPTGWDAALGGIGVVSIFVATFLLTDIWTVLKQRRKEPPVSEKEPPQGTGVFDSIEPNLRPILKLAYKNLLRQDLIEIRQRLYNISQHRDEPFRVWNVPTPIAKKQLLDDEIIYNAVEDFSTTLNERNSRLKKSDTTFSAWNQLCIKHYDKFREIGFIA